MAILKIARLGHPVLRKQAKRVSKKMMESDSFHAFCEDLLETVEEYEGIGLAAPQVHHSLQVVVVCLWALYTKEEEKEFEKCHQLIPDGILINPGYTPATEKQEEGWEGCLSVPDMNGRVSRFQEITLKGSNKEGKRIRINLKGMPAIAFQHEIDHLHGILYVDKLVSMKDFGFQNEIKRFQVPSHLKKSSHNA